MSAALLSVRGLVKEYPARDRGTFRAVDGVDLTIGRGEIVGLVGESGSGKTTLGRAILRLVEPSAGSVHFDGIDVRGLAARPLRQLRRRMQIVFQDPGAALNPRMTVGALVGEPLVIHGLARGAALAQRVAALLEEVGLDPAAATHYPGEFSGGQRQRIGIARAIGVGPDFVVCDEPVASLDVSIQAQIVNLLAELQQRRGTAFLFIAHDLDLVAHFCDRVAVMYRGRIVEEGPARSLREAALHPYTNTLFAAAPRTRGDSIPDEVTASGCAYQPRCPFAIERCAREEPPARDFGSDRRVACHRAEELAPPPLRPKETERP